LALQAIKVAKVLLDFKVAKVQQARQEIQAWQV
jgi:hypothetical protein